jgi:hypothetical protein
MLSLTETDDSHNHNYYAMQIISYPGRCITAFASIRIFIVGSFIAYSYLDFDNNDDSIFWTTAFIGLMSLLNLSMGIIHMVKKTSITAADSSSNINKSTILLYHFINYAASLYSVFVVISGGTKWNIGFLLALTFYFLSIVCDIHFFADRMIFEVSTSYLEYIKQYFSLHLSMMIPLVGMLAASSITNDMPIYSKVGFGSMFLILLIDYIMHYFLSHVFSFSEYKVRLFYVLQYVKYAFFGLLPYDNEQYAYLYAIIYIAWQLVAFFILSSRKKDFES